MVNVKPNRHSSAPSAGDPSADRPVFDDAIRPVGPTPIIFYEMY